MKDHSSVAHGVGQQTYPNQHFVSLFLSVFMPGLDLVNLGLLILSCEKNSLSKLTSVSVLITLPLTIPGSVVSFVGCPQVRLLVKLSLKVTPPPLYYSLSAASLTTLGCQFQPELIVGEYLILLHLPTPFYLLFPTLLLLKGKQWHLREHTE